MATYYVSNATGLDTDSGLTEALAWKTVDKAMNTVAAGDKVWVKADGNYAELVTIDTAGTNLNPIIFEGYTSVTGDLGIATITGSSSRANCITTGITTNAYYIFKNFRFTASTSCCANLVIPHYVFDNCQFDSATGDGGCSCDFAIFINCKFNDNTGDGCNTGNLSRTAYFIKCQFYRNSLNGLNNAAGGCVALFCKFFSNGSDNISSGGSNDQALVVANCTIDGDSKDSNNGIHSVGIGSIRSIIVLVNSIIYDCAIGVGIDHDRGKYQVSKNNLINSNTTDYSSFLAGDNELTSAPGFTNEVGGADYTPAAGSPLINAGFDGGS